MTAPNGEFVQLACAVDHDAVHVVRRFGPLFTIEYVAGTNVAGRLSG